jgi:hypothetical protein
MTAATVPVPRPVAIDAASPKTSLTTDRIAFAVPGDYQTLKFYFQPGVAAYASLVGKRAERNCHA